MVPDKVKKLYSQFNPDLACQVARATCDDIELLARLVKMPIPNSLAEWLMFIDNYDVGAGYCLTLNGTGTIYDVLRDHPMWIEKGWVPIANDGCGNWYINAINYQGLKKPVIVVYDNDPDQPGSIVGSDLFHFLEFFLDSDLNRNDRWWPLDRDRFILNDPDVVLFCDLPKPWDE